MPPKAVDVNTLIAKRDNALSSLHELFEEFELVIEIEPELSTVKNIYAQIEPKYRSFKKHLEVIADRGIELGLSPDDEILSNNTQVGSSAKDRFLSITKTYALYQKTHHVSESNAIEGFKEMNSTLQQMAEAMKAKGDKSNCLEKLPVPSWDGDRKSYATWRFEFNRCMKKYSQDSDEQLQRLRMALPKQLFWTNQIKYCYSIAQAWEVLDTEFQNKRKLMDDILKDITNLKPAKSDSKSLARYAARILSFANNMKLNGCPVTDSTEAPFVMSQLLSKLESQDNVEFGREMNRSKKEENIANLIEWLNNEATLRSRGKPTYEVKSDSLASETSSEDDECPLGCTSKHLLPACSLYQAASVDEKWNIVKKNNRCRKCLKSHHTNNCFKPDGSTCNKCDRRHHKSLHNESFSPKPRNSSPMNPEAPPFTSHGTTTSSSHVHGNAGKLPGICPVQKVRIKDEEGNHTEVVAMIDSGSNTSFISKSVAKKLGIKGRETHLTMNLAGGKRRSESSELVNITIVSPLDESIEKPVSVYTISTPCSPAKTVSKQAVNNCEHLRTITNKLHLSGGKVDLLIGTDIADAFVDIHLLQGKAREPIAKRNCFGWYLLGQLENENTYSEINSVEVGTVSVLEDMKSLLMQDQLGVKPTELCTCTDNTLKETKFIKTIAGSTEMIDGRVQVRMPSKVTGPPKRSNYEIVLKRMISSEKTFQRKNCFDVIQNEINKLLEQEFIIEIPTSQVNHEEPEWYLPLQAVFTPDRTTQVRLVFDASAKGHDGQSLNERLEKGPNYINSLPDVFIAWRWDQVAFCGDIRKMFNQVLIHPDDQIFHRFLWRNNTSEPPRIFQWVRLNFGDKPAPDIATGAINTLARAAQAEHSEGAQELLTHTYVDDIGGSRRNETEVKKVTKEIDAILMTGKFQVKAWHSNAKTVDQADGESTSFLGHNWDKQNDSFTFKKQEIVTKLNNLTKRDCLKCLAQLWDPIGLSVPVTIDLRIDLQELWSAGYGWDEILSNSLQMKWIKNIQVLNELLTFEFKRQLRPQNTVGPPEIHGFSDGGDKAYGAVIFLRWMLFDGSYMCVPLMIKAFVAPLKKRSVPRLELMGCLALSRLHGTCKEALTFAEIDSCKKVFWIDSQTVLSWIKTPPKKFKPFVSTRVAEIQESVDVEEFRYVRSEWNPADALTRGVQVSQLEEWMKGPPFLHLPEDEWPKFHKQEKAANDTEASKELKREYDAERILDHVDCKESSRKPTHNDVLDHLMNACSTFHKARKTLGFVLRFIHNIKTNTKKSGCLSVQELKQSEIMLYKLSQVELDLGKLDKKLTAKEDGDGVIRAHGRLENIRTLPAEMRNPVILPRNHQLVKLILRHLHEARGHCGYKSLIYEVRRKYWIIGLRSAAKQLTRQCVTCKKLRKKPLEQMMGQLPSIRVSHCQPAFSHTALDMFGPIQIRLNRKTLKEAQVILFTCTTSRAIHLELCTDKSTDTFIMAFRRFASLRGHPVVCWSDCGTNFKGAQRYFADIQNWDLEKIKNILSNEYSCQFEWLWNTPHASHMNGVVESLIKSVRQAINATCKNRPFTEEQWRTTLAEITYLVNSRPLYPSSDDIWESPPITPNDLIIGNHISPPTPELEERVNPRHLAECTQQRISEFWIAWQKYFAPTLLPRNKWFRPRNNLQVGDLVLEIEKTPRRKWKMAVVEEIFPGADHLVRKARIKTREGVYDRPIHKLCLIATRQELYEQ